MTTFEEALVIVKQFKTQGDIISYCVETGCTGRAIYIESDQGWNPSPMWEEFPEPFVFVDY